MAFGANLRTTLNRLLGIPDTRCDLVPEKRGEIDLDHVVVEKWLFNAEPGSRIPLNLYRPRQMTERIPAIVMTCGHGGSKSVPVLNYIARTYAMSGIACLLADPFGEEERHHEGGMGTRAHDAQSVAYRCELAGRPVMGKFVFDAMRSLDFLESLNWVNHDRLGVAGNSLGGAIAGWLYALEPRLRAVIVSGWTFSDYLCFQHGKHCTRVPNLKLRAVCDWDEFLRLGFEHAACLVMNGDADSIIDDDTSGTVWRDTKEHCVTVDPARERLRTWFCHGGGHRAYHGTAHALRFMEEHLGTCSTTAHEIAELPEIHYGAWCDRYGIQLESLYGIELHHRGVMLPDLGLKPLDRVSLAVLTPDEVGNADYTIDGWLEAYTNPEA